MLQIRPPVIVILGHVDHGKTSLLDKIRSSSVAAREAGGITQHIGAYSVNFEIQNSKFEFTFLDTPGHAAFSQMRSRGGAIADIAILVVSAVDGVMPQTKEAIQIIQSAKLPVIVAANKIDLPDASLDKLKGQLAENNLSPEDYGGDVPVIPVSAKTGQGIPELLEMIHLLNELHPTRSDPDSPFEGIIIESRLDKQKGPSATILVKSGTLRVGDTIYSESIKCKVRHLSDEKTPSLTQALPASPVAVLGFESVPDVGALVSTSPKPISPLTIKPNRFVKPASPQFKVILKADVAGSLEAITDSIKSNPDLELVKSDVGEVSESDVLDAVSLGARIMGFNVKVSGSVAKLAETENVNIKVYNIIYELFDDLAKQIERFKNPHLDEVIQGTAKILVIFEINADQVAGSKVQSGKISLGDRVHLKRGELFIADTKVKSLKKSKDSVNDVKIGDEFGAILSPAVDFIVGDMLVSFTRPSA